MATMARPTPAPTSPSPAASGRPHRWALLIPFPASVGEGVAWEQRRVTPRDVIHRVPIEDPEVGCIDCGEGIGAAEQPCSGEMGG